MSIAKVNTRAKWATLNPVLLPGETGLETDTKAKKNGDGKTPWNQLPYNGAAGYWGDFADTSDQTATANTPTSVLFRVDDIHNRGVRVVNNTRITVEHPGIYGFTFVLQLSNNDTVIHDINVWLRLNDSGSSGDLPSTGTKVSVIESHGGVPGNNVIALNHAMLLAPNDYVELIWATSHVDAYLQASAAITSPYTRPATPSVHCSVVQIASA